MQRVVSLIASATEIVAGLGCLHRLVGRSHECDFPPEVERLPVLTAPRIEVSGSSAEIDARVKAATREALSVYRVDEGLLAALRPDVIVTQDHCEVCAVSLADVERAVRSWTRCEAKIVALHPDSLDDVFADIHRVGRALDRGEAAEELVARMRATLGDIAARVADRPHPGVALIEWIEPPMTAGNWMPTLVEIAGGRDLFGIAGAHSTWIEWEALRTADPDVIVILPCGFDIRRAAHEMHLLAARDGWQDLTAVRAKRIFIADGNQYFNRPGPRLADSARILAEILHPEVFPPAHEGHGWVRWPAEGGA